MTLARTRDSGNELDSRTDRCPVREITTSPDLSFAHGVRPRWSTSRFDQLRMGRLVSNSRCIVAPSFPPEQCRVMDIEKRRALPLNHAVGAYARFWLRITFPH